MPELDFEQLLGMVQPLLTKEQQAILIMIKPMIVTAMAESKKKADDAEQRLKQAETNVIELKNLFTQHLEGKL